MLRLAMSEMTTFRWSFEEDVANYAAAGFQGIGVWKHKLEDFGIEPDRLRLEWISAAEGKKYVDTMNDFSDQIRALGPLHLEQVTLTKEEICHE